MGVLLENPADPEILAQLEPRQLVYAYAQGYFPMVQEGQLYWFCPERRGLLPLDGRLHLSRSLRRLLRRGRFVCTIDRCFDAVVELCALRGETADAAMNAKGRAAGSGGPDEPGEEDGTWISPEIAVAYGQLHRLGLAHSVEAWPAEAVGEGLPVGGLYGVSLGAGFFAESMFHRRTDAGKVALATLLQRLRRLDYLLCDIQWTTPNLERFGAFELPEADYLPLLEKALSEVRDFCA